MASLIERFRNLSTQGKALAAGGLVVVVLAAALGVSAAMGGDSEPTTTTSEPATTTTDGPAGIAPLTGLPVTDPEVLARPAIGIKIGNNPEARPQAGLEVADVVYEEEVEGRVTRFLAVFHSAAPERVGPIRSVRLMDPFIFAPYDGVFVFSGGDQVGNRRARLNELGIEYMREGELDRVGARVLDPGHGNGRRPNILFAQPQRIWEASDKDAPQQMFGYLGEGEAFNGEPAERVTVPVGSGGFNPTWEWSAQDGVWKRFYGNQPFMSKAGEQVTATNLVVQYVERSGEESLVIGEGPVEILAEGEVVRGTWRKADAASPTQYFDANGNEIELVPGRTWVHLPLAGGTLRVG